MSSEAISQNQIQSMRIIDFLIILVLVFSFYIFRLFLLQVVQNTEWAAKAQENNTLQINLQSLRGIIYDRNDVTLSRNVAALNVVITAANLPEDTGAVQDVFRTLSELIDLPVN
jgi:penicillin-binding protein 2